MSKEEKTLILEMVAQGKITPEQGVELLGAVGASRGATASESGVKKDFEESLARVSQRAREMGKDADTIGQSAGNIGKLISELVAGGFSRGPKYEFTDEFKGELPEEGEIEITFRTSNGQIVVETWDRPNYSLTVKKQVNAGTEDEAGKILEDSYEFKQDGLVLQGSTRKETGFGIRNLSVGFFLKIPASRKASLDLDSANGRIVVERVSGERCTATTANGRIRMSQCEFNDAELNTANGKIEYRGTAYRMIAGSANGRIDTELKGPGDWRFDTANGRIEVEICKEPGCAYEVDLASGLGKVRVDGLGDAQVLLDESRHYAGGRKYKARSLGFENAELKGHVKASTSLGRIEVQFL
jgi:hypothetical protein